MDKRPSERWWKSRVAVSALVALVLPAGITLALADERGGGLSPFSPSRVVVGPPTGIAPSERIDAERTGRATTPLPGEPVELWRRPVAGGLELPPVIDEAGNALVALTVPEIVKVSSDGKELWRVRTGTAGATAPPTLTSDGTLVVLTSSGAAWGVSPSGAIRFNASLGIRGRDATQAPLATDDGGFVVAAGRELVIVDRQGGVIARAELDDRVATTPVPHAEGFIVATERGDVSVYRPPGAPHRLGTFGGAPRGGVVLADERTLIAVVDGRRIVALDLKTGTSDVRSGGLDPDVQLDAPVAMTATGNALATTYDGLLLGFDARGDEALRVPLEKQAGQGGFDGGAPTTFFGSVDARPSPPLVVDRAGRIAFARRGGKVGVVQPDGRTSLANDRLCGSPISLSPAGPGRLLVACRDGTLFMLGEGTPAEGSAD